LRSSYIPAVLVCGSALGESCNPAERNRSSAPKQWSQALLHVLTCPSQGLCRVFHMVQCKMERQQWWTPA